MISTIQIMRLHKDPEFVNEQLTHLPNEVNPLIFPIDIGRDLVVQLDFTAQPEQDLRHQLEVGGSEAHDTEHAWVLHAA